MAYAVMVYIVLAYVVMAYTVLDCAVMAYIVLAHVVMAYAVMACIVMAYAVMAYIANATHTASELHTAARWVLDTSEMALFLERTLFFRTHRRLERLGRRASIVMVNAVMDCIVMALYSYGPIQLWPYIVMA